jgi:hypothetical protein
VTTQLRKAQRTRETASTVLLGGCRRSDNSSAATLPRSRKLHEHAQCAHSVHTQSCPQNVRAVRARPRRMSHLHLTNSPSTTLCINGPTQQQQAHLPVSSRGGGIRVSSLRGDERAASFAVVVVTVRTTVEPSAVRKQVENGTCHEQRRKQFHPGTPFGAVNIA